MPARARRLSVRTTELDRVGRWLDARGWKPAIVRAVPGGMVDFVLAVPAGSQGELAETAEEAEAWDKALGG